MNLFTTTIPILLTFVGIIYCSLQLLPERVEVYYSQPEHIENFTLRIRRYGRQSPYYVTGQGILKRTWNNNVTLFIDTFEYLHNEYRPSIVTMHGKLCDIINKDAFAGPMFRKLGLICPFHPGVVVFNNITICWNDFPYVFPINKGLVNYTARNTATNELLLGVRLVASVKQDKKKIC